MSETPIIEITVRAFYTSIEADAVPSTRVQVQENGSGKLPDWDKLMAHLVKGVAEQIHGAPMTDIRPMTRDEVDIYCADEGEG